MALQNRVAPDGGLHAVSARGSFTGNRGIIHDPDRRTPLRRKWTTKSWIVCSLEWDARRRDVWGRNGRHGGTGWSELFFLDEVTALAAGHRPCFFCRREAANAFAAAFRTGNGWKTGTVKEIDDCLHRQRRLSSKQESSSMNGVALAALPVGVVVEAKNRFFAIHDGEALPWSFDGYGRPVPLARLGQRAVSLVTPEATVKALRAGFAPAWHASAAS